MKKLNLFLIVIVSFGSIYASDFGFKAGFNRTSFRGDFHNQKYFNYRHSKIYTYQFGFTYCHKIFKNFSIQSELNYDLRGGQFNSDSIRVFPLRYKIKHIDLPILLKYNFNKFEDTESSAYLGIYVSKLVSGKYEYENSTDAQDFKQNGKIDDNLKNLEYGLNLGFDYSLIPHSIPILIDFRYTTSFTPTFSSKYTKQFRYSLFTLSLAYIIQIN